MTNSCRTTSGPRLHGPRAHLVTGWTALWNGDLTAAEQVCSDALRVRFGGRAIAVDGDRVSTPEDMALLVSDFRSSRPGLTYRVVEAWTTETWGHCVWDADLGSLAVGGIDTFTFDEHGISQVHSVTAERPMSW